MTLKKVFEEKNDWKHLKLGKGYKPTDSRTPNRLNPKKRLMSQP